MKRILLLLLTMLPFTAFAQSFDGITPCLAPCDVAPCDESGGL